MIKILMNEIRAYHGAESAKARHGTDIRMHKKSPLKKINITVLWSNVWLRMFIFTCVLLTLGVIILLPQIPFFIFIVAVTGIGVYFVAKHRLAVDPTFMFFGSMLVARLDGLWWLVIFIILADIIPHFLAGAMQGPDMLFQFGVIVLMGYFIRLFPNVHFQILAIIAVLIFGAYQFLVQIIFVRDIPRSVMVVGVWLFANLAYAIGFGRYF